MNFINILKEIEKADPEVYEKLSPRRHVLKSFGAKVALAAAPFAIGALFQKAYGKTTDAVLDTLNFALELEYLEYNFYHTANNTGGLIPAAAMQGFKTIETHEHEHVLFLRNAITTAGGTPYAPPGYNASNLEPEYIPSAYDFTAGGTLHVFENYNVFLEVAQTFEDTGVRAYNGQLPNLTGTAAVLQPALQIMVVEARHAAHIRLLRRFAGAPEYPAPWIVNNIPPDASLQANYAGEDNTVQRGVDITTLPDPKAADGTVPKTAATAAFDEPLPKATVAMLIAPFLK